MKLIIDAPDDFVAGECYDYTNGAKCPFAARGCWAGAKGFEKCPLKEARPAVEVSTTEDYSEKVTDYSRLYLVEDKKP